jgi:hypothetical protein
MREDSTWSAPAPEQRETLESWLFEENLGSVETLARLQSVSNLRRTIAGGPTGGSLSTRRGYGRWPVLCDDRPSE